MRPIVTYLTWTPGHILCKTGNALPDSEHPHLLLVMTSQFQALFRYSPSASHRRHPPSAVRIALNGSVGRTLFHCFHFDWEGLPGGGIWVARAPGTCTVCRRRRPSSVFSLMPTASIVPGQDGQHGWHTPVSRRLYSTICRVENKYSVARVVSHQHAPLHACLVGECGASKRASSLEPGSFLKHSNQHQQPSTTPNTMSESNAAAEALVPKFQFERLLNQGTECT